MGGRKKKTGGARKKKTAFDVSLVDLCDSSDNDDDGSKNGIDIITLDDTPVANRTNTNTDADDSTISVASLSLNSPFNSPTKKSPSSTKTSPRQKSNTTKVKTKVSGKIRSFRKNENDLSLLDKTTEEGECSASDDTDIEIVGVKMRTPSSVKKRKLKQRYFTSPFQHDITMSARRRKSLLSSTNSNNRFSVFTLTSSNTNNNRGDKNNQNNNNNYNNNNQKFSLKPKLVGIRKKNKKKRNNFSSSPTTTGKNTKLRHQIDPSTVLFRHGMSPVSRINRNPEYKHKSFYQNAIRNNANNNYNKNDKGILKRSKFTIDVSSLHPSAVLQAQNALLLPASSSLAPSTSSNLFSLPQQQQQTQVPASSSTTTPGGTERSVTNTVDGSSLKISILPTSNSNNNNTNNTTNLSNDAQVAKQQQQQPPPQQSNWSMFGSNLYHSEREIPVAGSLRPVIIDGSNVAVSHGKCLYPQQDKGREIFSCRGIKICSDYFKSRGHNRIIVFVPQFRKKLSQSMETRVLDELEKEGILKCTPSRDVGTTGKRISSYDDRFIVQCAADLQGVIVSNDNFRDLYDEQPLWRDTITNRVLGFTWATETMLMFPPDPLGHSGPPLNEFLRFPIAV